MVPCCNVNVAYAIFYSCLSMLILLFQFSTTRLFSVFTTVSHSAVSIPFLTFPVPCLYLCVCRCPPLQFFLFEVGLNAARQNVMFGSNSCLFNFLLLTERIRVVFHFLDHLPHNSSKVQSVTRNSHHSLKSMW